MSFFKPGHVVTVPFAFTDSNGTIVQKIRPGVILKEGPQLVFAIIQVTKTNRTDGSSGIWVKKDSQRGIDMGLHFDSFINLEVIRRFAEREILNLIGEVDEDCLDQLEFLYEELHKPR